MTEEEDMAAALAAAMSGRELVPGDHQGEGTAVWHDTGAYNLFFRLAGGGIINLFGDTKVGKTKIATTLAMDARVQGKDVVYFDLEHNLHPTAILVMKQAGIDYRYVKKIRDVRTAIRSLDCDFMVADSVTLHITGTYFDKDMHGKGNLLLELQNTMYLISDWAGESARLALVVSQPVSEFGDRALSPMGDKAHFWSKEELYVKRVRKGLNVKSRELYIFDSRILPAGEKVAIFTTEPVGVRWEWISESLKGL